jgi:hypothetical protein
MVVFSLIGCATTKSTSNGNKIGVKSEPKNGISLSFDSIPQDVSNIFITLRPANATTETGKEVFATIENEVLKELKQSNSLNCPFVQDGQEYTITLMCSKKNGEYPITTSDCVAQGGTHLSNQPALVLDKEKSIVTLSEAPEFSTNVNYANDKYEFSITVMDKNNRSYAYTEKGNELQSNFSGISKDFTAKGLNLHGRYSAYVTAFCLLTNDKVCWTVAVAKTDDFNLDF